MNCLDCGAEIPSNLAACPECLKPIPQPVQAVPQVDSIPSLEVRGKSLSIGLSLAGYLAPMAVFVVDAFIEPRPIGLRAFGPRPLGLHYLCFEMLLFTLVYVPFPWFIFPAFTKLMSHSGSNKPAGLFGLLIYAWKIGDSDPRTAEASFHFFCGLVYTVFLITAWGIYTAWVGI